MKKLRMIAMTLVLALLLAAPAAATGIDLSALSWDELIALKAEIGKEQMSRDEWQEVEVPQGVWVVGEDIPAGKWTVRCTSGTYCRLAWGDTLDASGHDISYDSSERDTAWIYNPAKAHADDTKEYTFDAKDGMYVCIESAPAVFSPYAGKPDLGFKK